MTWHFRVYRISLSFCELDKRRDSSFFHSRNAGFQHYRGICLCGNGIRGIFSCGNGLLSICAGRVCAGTRFRFFHGTTGYGISLFHGIRYFAFCTEPRDNPESRTIPREKSRGRPRKLRVEVFWHTWYWPTSYQLPFCFWRFGLIYLNDIVSQRI